MNALDLNKYDVRELGAKEQSMVDGGSLLAIAAFFAVGAFIGWMIAKHDNGADSSTTLSVGSSSPLK